MDYKPGNIVHIEIPAPDMPKLKAFYGALLGWTFRPLHDAYEFFDAGNLAGAFAGHMQPSETGEVITVLADDVATKLNKAAELGGRIVQQPMEVPGGGGVFGYFEDPCGNRIGVWMRPTEAS